MNTQETTFAPPISLRAPVPALLDSERQRCEIWTRVMGYHRPVASFNAGKQAEHAERRFFRLAPTGVRG